jgi:hypothetical protein
MPTISDQNAHPGKALMAWIHLLVAMDGGSQLLPEN